MRIPRKIINIFRSYPEIKLVYFFGSRATSKESSLSDYDFAIFLDLKEKKRMYEIKFELYDVLARTLKTDKIDIVILNLTQSPELKYQIIKEGSVIFQREPYKIIVEPKVLNEYFDFQALLMRYNLTRA